METLYSFELNGINFQVWAFSLERAKGKAKAKLKIMAFFGRNLPKHIALGA
jgi:hypothetical protein